MNKFNKFFADHGIKLVVVLLVLSYFKSCSIDSEVERIKKEQRVLTEEIDTLASELVNETEMIELIKSLFWYEIIFIAICLIIFSIFYFNAR